MLTKIPLQLVHGRGQPGSEVRFNGVDLVITPPEANANDFGIAGGQYDPITGQLSLTLRNGGVIEFSGFTTTGDIGVGPAGPTGPAGRDGRDGLNGIAGEKGATGCQGPAGPQGRQGVRGEQGIPGPTGPRGAAGATGPKGEDGIVQVWIQSEDPVTTSPDHIIPGALWVKP